jgi:hypothetical protein
VSREKASEEREMRRVCEATVTVAAPPEAVWNVVSDVTRVGEWSGECRSNEWVGEPARAVPSARFRGGNRRTWMRWSRLSEIDVAKPDKELVWHTVFSPVYRDSTEWRIGLNPVSGGTEVTLGFRVLRLSRWMEPLIGLAQPAHRDRTGDLEDDLARLKKVVEGAVLPT